MSKKIKFGNFITYKGKNLATPKAKAVKGNLVFAEITEGADKGYYIFGGVAEGHLVTYDVFNAFKNELVGTGNLELPKHDDGTYYSIVEYVNSRLTGYNVKDVKVGSTSIVVDGVVTLGNAAQKNVAAAIAENSTDLATAGQVYAAIDAIPEVVVAQGTGIAVGSTTADGTTTYTVSVDSTIATTSYVDDKFTKLGDVVKFLGVVAEVPEDNMVPIKEGENAGKFLPAEKGDIILTTAGKEYVWDGAKWEEIGNASLNDSVITAQGSTYVTVAGEGEGDQKTGNVTISVVTSAIEKGATGLATAADVFDAIKVTGATGYLKVENKNVVVDAAQVELGATGTSTKLVTLGYVEGQLENLSNDINDAKTEAAKHSSVTSASADYIGVTGVTGTSGVEYKVSLKAEALKAEKHSISEIKIDGESVTTASTVQEALQDLFEGDKTASEALTDLNDRLEAHIGSTQAHAAANITYAGATGVTGVTATNVEEALDDLYSRVEAAALSGNAINITYAGATGSTATNVEAALDELYAQIATLDGAAVKEVQGDTASYSQVVDSVDDDQVKIVKNVLAPVVATNDIEDYTAAKASGLATDAYVKDYVAYSLAWEDITD